MLKIGIVGYGNLGKALKKRAEEDDEIEVVGIFSRRKFDEAKFYDVESIDEFQGKLDCVLIAVGSKGDATAALAKIAGKFDTVDCFDGHGKMAWHIAAANDRAKQGGKLSVVAVGWDPGVMSVVRSLCMLAPSATVATFWGKGVSQGHTNALKTIDGVDDAVQFTVPKSKFVRMAKRGKILSNTRKSHLRICYIYSKYGDKKQIKSRIREMDEYFAGYEVRVRFRRKNTVERLKKDASHRGAVVSVNDCGRCKFEIETTSNPMLTAGIMLSYAKAIPMLKKQGYLGAKTCLDLPLAPVVETKTL